MSLILKIYLGRKVVAKIKNLPGSRIVEQSLEACVFIPDLYRDKDKDKTLFLQYQVTFISKVALLLSLVDFLSSKRIFLRSW